MSRNTKRAGFTIAELTVFSALLLLLLGGLYLLLVGGLRTMQQAGSYQTVQQQALVAMRKLTNELSKAHSDWPTYLAYQTEAVGQTPYIVFLSADLSMGTAGSGSALQYVSSGADTGRLAFQKWVAYWLQNQQLVRSESPQFASPGDVLDGPVPNPNPPMPSMATLPPALWSAPQRIADNIADLYFGPGPATANGLQVNGGIAPCGYTIYSVDVTIYSQDATASDKVTQVKFADNVFLQN